MKWGNEKKNTKSIGRNKEEGGGKWQIEGEVCIEEERWPYCAYISYLSVYLLTYLLITYPSI
jgi:hypothetical protein